MVPPSQSVLRTSTRRNDRGKVSRSISSNSCITSSALIVGGLERGVGSEAHHSTGALVSGSVIVVYWMLLFDFRANVGRLLERLNRFDG